MLFEFSTSVALFAGTKLHSATAAVNCGSMLLRPLTIAGWLLALQANVAATATLELTTEERARLGQLVCGADPESITAVARDTSRPGDYADVQCKPHSTHQAHQVAKWARCSRPGKGADWHCAAPIATVRIEAAGRDIQIHHTGVPTDLALNAVSYLLSGPTSGRLHFDPTWLDSVVRVFAASGQIVVSSGSQIATLRIRGAGPREFELEQISHCDTDTCVPL